MNCMFLRKKTFPVLIKFLKRYPDLIRYSCVAIDPISITGFSINRFESFGIRINAVMVPTLNASENI